MMLESFTGKRISDRELAEKRHNANPGFSLPRKRSGQSNRGNEFNAIAGEMMSFFGYD